MNANRILERDFASARRCEEARLFVHLLDEGVLVNTNGLACLATPMGEREIDEIVEPTDRVAARLAKDGG